MSYLNEIVGLLNLSGEKNREAIAILTQMIESEMAKVSASITLSSDYLRMLRGDVSVSATLESYEAALTKAFDRLVEVEFQLEQVRSFMNLCEEKRAEYLDMLLG